jgi:hypothetical protein
VTLFVTASGLGRQEFTAGDAAGQTFTVEDHRFLYQFAKDARLRYRRGTYQTDETNGFADTAALAVAARASASFPVAFAATQEADGLVGRPPRVRPKTETPASWLVDGGVLDNAPFGPVLDQIARRPVAERATRYVLYVVPSSGVGAATAESASTEPRWTTAAFSAIQYPREVDFRSDVEELERLLLEADASWSDTQQLFDTCLVNEPEARRINEAAALLQPAYVRGRAAGGVWEAVTVATHNQATVLDVTAAVTESDVDAILAEAPRWVPAPGEPPLVTQPGEHGPIWAWGTGPAERVLRLVLRSLRRRLESSVTSPGAEVSDVDSLRQRLARVDEALQRVMAVRDALTAVVEQATFKPDHPPAAIARGVNKIFDELDAPAALGAVMAGLAEVVPGEVELALSVEIVSRCTSARTPLQRSAPFRFLRLGPDVPLPILRGTTAGRLAATLGDRILFGTQVGHFGAFGAPGWRRWDWLMGRLHGAAHLGRMLGADEQWIRGTQQAILEAEARTLEDVTAQVARLATAFPPGPGASRRALAYMLDELSASDTGRQTVRGLVDRLVAVSSGLSPEFGAWTRAVAGRTDQPDRADKRWARWFTRPARITLWQRLARDAAHDRASAPPLPVRWPIVALLTLCFGALAVALFRAGSVPTALLGLGAGATFIVTVALAATRWWLDGKRRYLRDWVGRLIPDPYR